MSTAWFSEYLLPKLELLDVDTLFTEFIVGLLIENDTQRLQELLMELNVPNSESFRAEITKVFNRKFLLPGEQLKVEKKENKLIQHENVDHEYVSELNSNDSTGVINSSLSDEPSIDDIPEVENGQSDDVYDSEQFVDWVLLMEEVESMLEVTYSPYAIYYALGKAQGSVPHAIAILQEASKVLDGCKPCRHMLTDKCYRRDCMFDHQVSDVPCRYWLYSNCLQQQEYVNEDGTDGVTFGDCPFMHDLPYVDAPQTWNGYEAEQQTQSQYDATYDYSESNTSFPSLSSTTTVNHGNSWGGGAKKFSQVLQQDSPARARGGSGGGTYSIRDNFANYTPSSQWDTSEFVQRSGNVGSSSYYSTVSSSATKAKNLSSKLLASEWVESGDVVRRDYLQWRAEARKYALARNKLLESATKAFIAGKREQARAMSIEGQRLNDKMKMCHTTAAQAIFKRRNTSASVSAGKIDLHGLHVSEAQDCLWALLPVLSDMNDNPITIITGSGHHTQGPQSGRSRLFPAVKAQCEEMRYRIRVIKDDNGFPGGVQIIHKGR